MKIAICDDEERFNKELLIMLKEYLKRKNLNFNYESFNNGEDLLKTCDLEGYTYNIIFLDIIMKSINGIEVAKKIKKKNPNCEIIFVTSSSEFVFDAFQANPFNYLLKPIEYYKLKIELDKIIEKLGGQEEERKFITVKKGLGIVFINPKDILYVEANNRVVTIHCLYDKISFNGSISKVFEEINDISMFDMIKCHRSYIVNPYYIKKMDCSKIVLNNEEVIPVSRLKYSLIKTQILMFFSEKYNKI